MLHLNARVHLHEVKAAAAIQQKLNGACAFVLDAAGRCHGGFAHATAKFRVEGRAGGFFEQFLVAPLNGAVPFAQVHDIAVTVGDELITVEHAYSHKKLRFVVHLCAWEAGEPQPLASQQVRWVMPDQLRDYPFPAANARIIEALLGRLQGQSQA